MRRLNRRSLVVGALLTLVVACSDESPSARPGDGGAVDGGDVADAAAADGGGRAFDGATPVPDGPPAPGPTKILAPAAGAALVEGATVALKGQGTGTLTWSYDANSDGEEELPIGQGASVDFVVPGGIKPPRELTLFLSSSAGKVEQLHPITAAAVDGGTLTDGGPPADAGSPADAGPPPPGCKGFVEAGGLVLMEVESAPLAGEWSQQTANAGYTGSGYYEWKQGDSSGGTDPAGSGVLTYAICVATTGRYQLHIRSAAPHSTEHNDVWVRFPDTGAIRKKGSDPDVSLGTSWFKVYENKSGDTWQWQTTTVDNNAHEIFVDVGAPRGFRVELSGRSTQFKVDRIVLRHASVSESAATDATQPESSAQ